MSYSIMSHYLIRSPLLPIERRNKVKGASSFEGKVAFLEDVLDDEVFVEAIEWGSPALYSQVCKFRDGCNRNDETSIDKLYYSVLKYYLRALYRATPYGLFSGIDIGEIGDCDSVVRVSQNSLSLQIRPDFEVISKLVRDIESDSELDSLLEFRINPNHYLINNRIIIHHLSAVYCEDITSNKTVSLRKSPLLDKIISHFRGQLFTKRDLKRFILSIHPDVSMDLLKSYTNNLVHSEFIISSIRPPFSGEDSISYINAACQKLKNSSKSVELVGKICSSLEKLQRAPIGKRENEIRKMRENLSQKGITFKDALQADLKINYSNNTLSRTSIAELESTLSELLSSITGYTENLTLAKFKSRFLDKYGYFKAVRLPEALDPYSELYEYGPSIQSNFTDSRSKAVKTNQTFSIICDKIETSRNSRIFINSEDLLRLSDGASKFENLPPRTFDYSFNIIKELGQANQYLISPIVGTNGYGMVMGRFAYLLDEEKQQWLKNDAKDIQKRCFDAGYVVVEYHEYPSKARIGNLNQSMNLFDYQICLSTNSSKEAIELDINDFYVGIDKQGFIYVYSESLDKRVIFAFQNMVNPHLLSPIGNFLMAVSHQFPNDLAYFIQDVKNCPIVHLPRGVFKNIILSPERWSFDVSSRLESLDSFKTFVRQQMETHSIPSIIEYGISDNRMIVDLTDPDQIHMVYNELKAKKSQYLTLYEPLYLAKSWTSDCFENHYNAEYVFSIYENTDERDRTTTVDMHSTFELEPLLGLSGILRYLLLTDSELYRESIQKVVDALIYLSQYSTDKQEAVPNWHIQKDNVFPYEERESYRSGMINFGLSHGIAGPLAVLSVAKLQGINRPGLAEAIGRLIEFFLCFVQEQPDGEVYWPSAITGEEYLKPALSISPHKRLSWCYGSLSILRSLFLASKAVSNEKIQIWAVNKAIRFTKMPLEKYLFESPTICHGYSGALILFESFYRDTHETAFLDAIERLQRKICSMNSMSYKYGFQNIDWIKGKYNIEDDLSLLSGASGVLLALSSRYCTCSYLLAHLLIT